MAFDGQLVFLTGESRAARAGPANVADGNAFRGRFSQAFQHISPKPAGMLKQTIASGHTEMTQGVVMQQVVTSRPVTKQTVASTLGRSKRRRS